MKPTFLSNETLTNGTLIANLDMQIHSGDLHHPQMSSSSPPSDVPVVDESMSSWAILILISLLLLTLFTSYFLQLTRARFIHESVLSTLLGTFVSLDLSYKTLAELYLGLFVGLIIHISHGIVPSPFPHLSAAVLTLPCRERSPENGRF